MRRYYFLVLAMTKATRANYSTFMLNYLFAPLFILFGLNYMGSMYTSGQ